jgi:hypothetical protein
VWVCDAIQRVSDFKDSDGKVLFCYACGKSIVTQQHSQVTQNLSGSRHIATIAQLKQKDGPGRQSLIGESSATSSSSGPSKFATFATDLCKAFVSADIPLFKINNPEVRNFLLKYTKTDPQNDSTLRKNYLPKCYEETLNKIQVLCRKENIWVSIDETTEASGRKVANVVTGVLKNDQTLSEESFLLITVYQCGPVIPTLQNILQGQSEQILLYLLFLLLFLCGHMIMLV